ncbi:MAG TPA: bifunctional diguanylate cyclase/phosphodiesterase, partial [Planctomycetota bacterium]|nr:bifunctional diguanylate cyclase/phosphodiesterase [Planctomycetota bacterium]
DVVVEGRDTRRRFLRLQRAHGAASGALPAGYVSDLGDPWLTLDDDEAYCAIDPHTGLPTRDQFVKQLEQAVSRASRRRHQLATIVIELEGLDDGARSPEVQAALLRQAAQRLKRSLRDSDLVGKVRTRASDAELARMSGESFSLMLELERAYDASNVARRLLEHLAKPFVVGDGEHELRMDVGIALFPEDGSLAELLLDRAEQAAGEARREGSNCIQYYSCSMNASAFEKLTLEAALRQAIEDRQFQVYYQPKVRVDSERVVGFEALVRWRHPDLGIISPGQFIPVAEETGLIVQIGEWVLRRACADAFAWQAAGFEPVRVAVNLSSVQFREPRLFEVVMESLRDSGLDPRWLELELTESMLMKDAEGAVVILERLKREGIHIAIDDFGTGYSSLSYLKRFPIDSLKIDQSFVRDINTNADDAAISTSIILMGHSLKLQVVAEGVETRSQLAFLRVMQCDEAQGFLFSPPMPEERARLLLSPARPPAPGTADTAAA